MAAKKEKRNSVYVVEKRIRRGEWAATSRIHESRDAAIDYKLMLHAQPAYKEDSFRVTRYEATR